MPRTKIKPIIRRKQIFIAYRPQKGERFDDIAKQFSLADPGSVLDHRKNRRFKRTNPDPNKIQRPHRLYIPVQREQALPPHVLLSSDVAQGNEIKVLINGKQAFPEIEKTLKGAKETINLETYIFHNDKTGKRIANILIERAKAGVKVNVMVDSSGALDMYPLDKKLTKSGVDMIFALPIRESLKYYIRNFFKSEGISQKTHLEAHGLDNRDHRKLIVVDGKTAFLGGMNIGEEYSGEKKEWWHDVHMRVEGPIVSSLQSLFFERWMTERGNLGDIDANQHFPKIKKTPKGITVEALTTTPGVKKDIFLAYLKAIKKARKYIHIENAYLIHPRIIRALKRAKRKYGVDVKIIVPLEFQDVPVIENAMESVFWRMRKKGLDIREYPDRMCHTKVAVIDGKWATIGSCNLDNRSLRRDYELNLLFWDKKTIKELERDLFKKDLKISKPVKKPKHPVLARIRSWLILRLYRFL